MSRDVSGLPPPPADFAALDLWIEEIEPSRLLRLARRNKRTHYTFRRNARYRFDAPDKSFGVLYAAFDLRTAFAESLLRETPRKTSAVDRVVLGWDEVDDRRVVTLGAGSAARQLRLISLCGDGLVAARIDNRIATVDDYVTTRKWAKACHSHPLKADGILYMSRFLGDSRSVALFDRARRALEVSRVVPLISHADFDDVIEAFDVGIERPPAGRRR